MGLFRSNPGSENTSNIQILTNILRQTHLRDEVTLAARRPDVPQNDVRVEVGQLGDRKDRKPDQHLRLANRGVQRVVNKVRDNHPETPVVGAVLEQEVVPDRIMAVPVHKQRLEDALRVVKLPRKKRVVLERVVRESGELVLNPGRPGVQGFGKEVEQGVQCKGPEVLHHKESGP
jgi:hypothetical protein